MRTNKVSLSLSLCMCFSPPGTELEISEPCAGMLHDISSVSAHTCAYAWESKITLSIRYITFFRFHTSETTRTSFCNGRCISQWFGRACIISWVVSFYNGTAQNIRRPVTAIFAAALPGELSKPTQTAFAKMAKCLHPALNIFITPLTLWQCHNGMRHMHIFCICLGNENSDVCASMVP